MSNGGKIIKTYCGLIEAVKKNYKLCYTNLKVFSIKRPGKEEGLAISHFPLYFTKICHNQLIHLRISTISHINLPFK
jgi:hypothetical protein